MRMCRGHVRGVFMRVHWRSQLHEHDGKDEQIEHYAHMRRGSRRRKPVCQPEPVARMICRLWLSLSWF
jgi:hypothetical protein